MSTHPVPKRVLFGGYAPVHFLCFRPVYELLRSDPSIEVWLTGGFRHKDADGTHVYDLKGFYEPYGVDAGKVAPFEEVRDEPFDVVVCAHSSDVFFPGEVGQRIQIFHGVSFKNFAVRDKVLNYDYACIPGRYHAERFASQGIMGAADTQFLLTGFPKLDTLLTAVKARNSLLDAHGLDSAFPTVLYAPTGGKYNSLDEMGEEVIQAIRDHGGWNLLIKPHDHPKKAVDWTERLAPMENDRVRVVRDFDIVPFMAAADLLLTDASSVAMEYTLLDRPMVFLDVPALLRNVQERGGSLDLDTYGRKIGDMAAGPDEVVATVSSALLNPSRHSELRRRAAEHLFHDPGAAAVNVAAVVRHAAGLRARLPEGVVPLSHSRSVG